MNKEIFGAALMALSFMAVPAMADWTCEPLTDGISAHLVVTSVSSTEIDAREVQDGGSESYVFTYDSRMKAFEFPADENTYEGFSDIKSYHEDGDVLTLAIRTAKDTSGYITVDVNCKK